MEIERKWLVDKSKIRAFTNFGYRIEQHYLSDIEDDWVIRVRNEMGKYTLTLKGKGLMSRPEIEVDIDEETYFKSIEHSKKCVKKTRFYVFDSNGEHCYEIDVFDDHDFILCEVEFKSEKDALTFIPPKWCLQEVTMDPDYHNVNLAI